MINPERMDDPAHRSFPPGAVFKDSFVSVYFDDERVMHKKKRDHGPGEMEQVILQKKKIAEKPDLTP